MDLSGQELEEIPATVAPYAPTSSTILATDGSVGCGQDTYGWIKATQRDIQSQGLGSVAGRLSIMSSFHVEAQGVALLLAHSLDDEIQGAVFRLDNKGVVQRLQQT